MPTGYTAPIMDGITFEQFILSCARAFGALITMRDEPNDAPIPDEFQATDYHVKGLEKANADLAEFQVFTTKDYEAKAKEEFDQAIIHYNERKVKMETQCNQYQSMLSKVKSWIPPSSEHEGLKNFMIEQIESSIKFDCYEPDVPTLPTPEEWANAKLQSIAWNIDYHTKENSKEIERVASRNKWIKQLKESIK